MKLPGITHFMHFVEVDSTQNMAKAMAEVNTPSGSLFLADRQTEGRGRRGRKWQSPDGGLYFSLVLRPEFSVEKLGEVSLLTASAIASALYAHTGLLTKIKPPNDVLMAHPAKKPVYKKVCGILAEAKVTLKGKIAWLTIGVGINVNNGAPANLRKAASLRELTHETYHLQPILFSVLKQFWKNYRIWLKKQKQP
ncbi:MAG: biotin--[acetyl-CoA-carboxylase] ligase [Elusimicrobia bacterium RIFCSPLOWO2_12_FULL_59_9]|nr:MAG: biotin--[acetyl-CoA-carboxylase] ligase [Elusimicrobia bacterium RIFCSPLOWO2_12_FULL_59_9]